VRVPCVWIQLAARAQGLLVSKLYSALSSPEILHLHDVASIRFLQCAKKPKKGFLGVTGAIPGEAVG
jgi:hypothetical protein